MNVMEEARLIVQAGFDRRVEVKVDSEGISLMVYNDTGECHYEDWRTWGEILPDEV
jgi:hypothetical protein